uniref:Fibrinogen C domain-containing protein 1 n=1 Tax=Zeugodacus cucurbitae TaxID=28588 RepID=A0A0A1WX60_ZEUCU
MLRYLTVILVNYLLWLSIEHACGEYFDSNTICDCNCDVQVDVVRTFHQELQTMRKREDDILREISLVQTKLQSVDKHNGGGKPKPSSCVEAAAGSFKSGIYNIKLDKFSATPFDVFCNEETDYGGWLVIQRRVSDSVGFYRGWQDYKKGFGELAGNYWIGLEKLHALTSSCQQELYIELQKLNGDSYHARYTEFLIGSESEGYPLKVLGNYTGTAGDSMIFHVGMKFTTRDSDNDNAPQGNCAIDYKGAWWFDRCFTSHLNGKRIQNMTWNTLGNMEALKSALMMIRPTDKCLRRLSLKKDLYQ